MSSYTQSTAGVAGNTTDFPDIRSGAGAQGNNGAGAAGASGGGASGGGGGGGWNSSGHSSGSGGGGAGGSNDAGGGSAGWSSYYVGTNASNHHTVPTKSTNYLGQVSDLGRGGYGGTATQAATNGYNGWFYVLKIQNATPYDMGNIADTVTDTVDCGQITDTVNTVLQMGQIA